MRKNDPLAGLLPTVEAAAAARVKPASWRGMVARRQAPQPDIYILGHPLWRPETITRWLETHQTRARTPNPEGQDNAHDRA